MSNKLLPNLHLLLFIVTLLSVTGCVRKKFYYTEQKARSSAEAREMVLVRELGDRKRETAKLINDVGELNRELGKLDNQISDMMSEADLKSQQFGASSNELRTKLAQTQMKLEETQLALKEKKEKLASIDKKNEAKKQRLIKLNSELSEALIPWLNQGVEIELKADQVQVLLPNKILFDIRGLALSSGGKTCLLGLSNYLTKHPELSINVEAHTDYDIPKAVSDSWAWSAHRAQLICRTLVRDYNVNGNQLIPVCVGEYMPIASNETNEGKEMNRRTLLLVRYKY